MILIDADEVAKISTNNTMKDALVTYCFNRVISAWLNGKKEMRTKEVLVAAVKHGGNNARLASAINKDPNFALSHRYLLEALQPVQYKYFDVGIQLGLLYSSLKQQEVGQGDCGRCLTMVIMR